MVNGEPVEEPMPILDKMAAEARGTAESPAA